MALPTFLTGMAEFFILLLLFRKKLQDPIIPNEISLEKENVPLTILGLSVLGICTIFLVISGYFALPMYLISAISLGVLVLLSLIYFLITRTRPKVIGKTLLRAPYEIIPFVIGMFTLVLALEKHGITENIAKFFGNNGVSYIYGISSAFSANLINNISSTPCRRASQGGGCRSAGRGGRGKGRWGGLRRQAPSCACPPWHRIVRGRCSRNRDSCPPEGQTTNTWG